MDDATLKLELERLRALLSPIGIPWALSAGSAVYLYARNRPPTDLDVLVRPRDLSMVAASLGVDSDTESTSWGENSRIEMGKVEISGRLVLNLEGGRYPYEMDEEMVNRLRKRDFGGIDVPVLSPEDLIALKAVLQRGPEQGKHDFEDIQALIKVVNLDLAYLHNRLITMGAEARAKAVVEKLEAREGREGI